ncbi:MAG: hypothetical protein LQ350_004138, partial [Teloschistes chrysophthalmus]
MPKETTKSTRRSRAASRVFRDAFVTMRPCSACASRGLSCRVNRQHLECECCYINGQKCDLAPDYAGMDKAIKEAEKLDEEILEIRLKLARKERQRRYWLNRLKELGDQESKNILEIEAEEILEEQPEIPVTGSTSSEEIFADPALLAMSSDDFDEFLRSLPSGVGGTAAVSSGSSQ